MLISLKVGIGGESMPKDKVTLWITLIRRKKIIHLLIFAQDSSFCMYFKLGVFVQHTTSITIVNKSTQNQGSPHITSNWLQSHILLGYNKVAGLVGMVWKAQVIVSNFMITHDSCLKTWSLYHFHWLHLWTGCWFNLFRT